MKSYDGVHLPSATSVSLPGCNASYTYTVSLGTPSGFVVASTGSAGNATKAIHATLTGQNSFFCGIALSQGAAIKTWSAVVPATGSSNPKLLTNSTSSNAVTLDTCWTVTFQGDIVVGPGANPASVVSGEQLVTGTLSAASAATVFPSITAPTGLPSRGDITSTTTLTQDGQCSKIDVHGTTLTVSGNRTLYLTGSSSVSMDHSASIYIPTGSSLKLYVKGTVTVNNTTVSSGDGDPQRMLLFGTSTCTSVSISNGSVFYGGIYAPQAAGTLSDADLYGALVCKNITSMDTQAKLHYDNRLQNVQMPGGTSAYSVSYWQDN